MLELCIHEFNMTVIVIYIYSSDSKRAYCPNMRLNVIQLIFSPTSANIWFLDKVQDGELKKNRYDWCEIRWSLYDQEGKTFICTQFIISKDKYYCYVIPDTQFWKDRIKSINKNLQQFLEISSGRPLP